MGKKIADVVNDLQAGDPAVDGAAATVAQVKGMILEALQAGLTTDQVEQQIAEAFAKFQTGLDQALLAFVTQTQLVDSYWNPLSTRVSSLEGTLPGMVTTVQLQDAITALQQLAPAPHQATQDAAKAERGPIDPKYLAGLRYRTSQPRKGGPNDDDSTVHELVVRDLAPGDVLNWVEKDGKISFVTGDGQRVSVPK